jgi:histidine triad (HIT) family protein
LTTGLARAIELRLGLPAADRRCHASSADEGIFTMANCLFCSIVAGDIASTPVLSTELAYAFEDINPAAPVHVLVVPREHITDAAALLPDHGEALSAVLQAAQQAAVMKGIAHSGYRLVFNVGEDSGNSVPHLHLHVLGGRSMAWPPG